MLDYDMQLNDLHHALRRNDDTYRSVIINGEDTHYKIDRQGNVFSTFIKYQDSAPVKRTYSYPDRDDLPRCQIRIGGRGARRNKFIYLDRLVANAFIPNPNGYRYIVHLDYRLSNVNVENLRWADKKTWQEYKYHRLGRLLNQKETRLVPGTTYYVDSMGNFRSIYHPARGARKLKERHGNGVILRSDGRRRLYHADKTVAEAFVPNPQGLPYVKHLNGDLFDDRASNLAWCDWNEMVLCKYYYTNEAFRDLHILQVAGYYTLYASDEKGKLYSLLQGKPAKETNDKRRRGKHLFEFKIDGKKYHWTPDQIKEHSYPVPPIAS